MTSLVMGAGGFTATDAFNSLMYGQSHPSTVQYLAQQVNRGMDILTDAGRAFMERAHQLYDHYHSQAAQRFAHQVISQATGEYQGQHIVLLQQLEQLQQASITMQRYLMANPQVRALYHKQMCAGYGATYLDMDPGDVGDAHYDYRRVMDGVMVFGDEVDWQFRTYYDELREGDRHLIHGEKMDIINSWDAMNVLLELGREDPTSPEGGSL